MDNEQIYTPKIHLKRTLKGFTVTVDNHAVGTASRKGYVRAESILKTAQETCAALGFARPEIERDKAYLRDEAIYSTDGSHLIDQTGWGGYRQGAGRKQNGEEPNS